MNECLSFDKSLAELTAGFLATAVVVTDQPSASFSVPQRSFRDSMKPSWFHAPSC